MDMLEFLNLNGIIVGEENFKKNYKDKSLYNFENQISLIVEIQKVLQGKRSTIIPRIESSIGRTIESFMVQSKKVSRMISLIDKKLLKDDFDYFIIEKASEVINRTNRIIGLLDKEEYLRIIRRSMNNYEICLGRVDEGNLQKENEIINIRTIKYLSYNMVEEDCYNYIKRIKRRGYCNDISDIIDDFVYKSKLDEESRRYLMILCSYPIESIKILLKLKYEESKFIKDKWIEKINQAQMIDGVELL